MSDNVLLSYYLKELSNFHEIGKRFARENPELAHHLQFELGFGQNPQLAQLIESLVFMNARVSYQFDQEYSQFINSMVDILYPHLSLPVPSMAIIQWPVEKNLEKSFSVPRGTLVETDPTVVSSARFSTVYNITIHPIKIVQAELLDNFSDLQLGSLKAKSIIKVRVASSNPKVALFNLEISELQFFIDGDEEISYLLYEILMQKCSTIAVVEKSEKNSIHWLEKKELVAMGFSEEEAMLPHDPRTLSGSRLITEFFSLPKKFLFFKLTNLPKVNQDCCYFDILFCLDSKPKKSLFKIGPEQFKLGCTPIINLFPKTVEPLEIKHKRYEYPVITDLRRPQDYGSVENPSG